MILDGYPLDRQIEKSRIGRFRIVIIEFDDKTEIVLAEKKNDFYLKPIESTTCDISYKSSMMIWSLLPYLLIVNGLDLIIAYGLSLTITVYMIYKLIQNQYKLNKCIKPFKSKIYKML